MWYSDTFMRRLILLVYFQDNLNKLLKSIEVISYICASPVSHYNLTDIIVSLLHCHIKCHIFPNANTYIYTVVVLKALYTIGSYSK